jgi:hypothetical protein
MPDTPAEILAAFRSGALSAEAAAQQLLPLLQTSGKPTLDTGPDVRPVLEALQRLANPAGPARRGLAEPLGWETPQWLSLPRVADGLWRIIRRHLERAPQCLRYLFAVRSAGAATALQEWITAHSDHQLTVDLPPSFQYSGGQIVGHTRTALLTQPDLVAWAAWLQSIPRVADAALTDLGLVSPRVLAAN